MLVIPALTIAALVTLRIGAYYAKPMPSQVLMVSAPTLRLTTYTKLLLLPLELA